MPSQKREGVQSVGRALDLLEALAESGGTSLSELADRTAMLPSTAHRLLASLSRRGYVVHGPEPGRYALGAKVIELAAGATAPSGSLRDLARPHLEALRELTGETTNLVILHGRDVVYLDQVEGTHALRMFTQVGSTAPAHTTGAGKAMLACLPPRELERRYPPGTELTALTGRTIDSLARLRDELALCARRGYALDNEEHEEGVSCVAVPVRDRDGRPLASLSTSGPSARILALVARDLPNELIERATLIGAAVEPRLPATV